MTRSQRPLPVPAGRRTPTGIRIDPVAPDLKLQPQRLRREFEKRHHRPARGGEVPHERRPADLPVAERNRRHEVLPLNVFDERVLGVVPAGRPSQAVPV